MTRHTVSSLTIYLIPPWRTSRAHPNLGRSGSKAEPLWRSKSIEPYFSQIPSGDDEKVEFMASCERVLDGPDVFRRVSIFGLPLLCLLIKTTSHVRIRCAVPLTNCPMLLYISQPAQICRQIDWRSKELPYVRLSYSGIMRLTLPASEPVH